MCLSASPPFLVFRSTRDGVQWELIFFHSYQMANPSPVQFLFFAGMLMMSVLLLSFVFYVTQVHWPIYPADLPKAFLVRKCQACHASIRLLSRAKSWNHICPDTNHVGFEKFPHVPTLVCTPAQMRFKG